MVPISNINERLFVFISVKKKHGQSKDYEQRFATASGTVINSQKPHCLPDTRYADAGGALHDQNAEWGKWGQMQIANIIIFLETWRRVLRWHTAARLISSRHITSLCLDRTGSKSSNR